MRHLVPLYIDAAAVSTVCLDTSADIASTTFKTDFFRSTATPYADWYEVVLNFDFTSTPPSLKLTRPGSAASLVIQLLSSDAATTSVSRPAIRVSSELLGQLESYNSSKKFSISVGNLMQADKSHPLVSLLGRSSDSSEFYKQLSGLYFDRFMDKRDREGLIRYANQIGIFTYARLFVEEAPAEPTKFLTLDPEQTSQEWSITKGRNSNSYIIKYSRPVIERNTLDNNATNLCEIHLAVPYNRVTQTLEGPLHVVLEFADDCSKEQREIITSRMIRLYQGYRKRSIDSGIVDPGELSLRSLKLSRKTGAFLGIGTASLIAAIIVAVLVGFGILPALPFLAGISLQLGHLLLSGTALSSILIAAVGVLAMSTINLASLTSVIKSSSLIPLADIVATNSSSPQSATLLSPAGATTVMTVDTTQVHPTAGATPAAEPPAVEPPDSIVSHAGH